MLKISICMLVPSRYELIREAITDHIPTAQVRRKSPDVLCREAQEGKALDLIILGVDDQSGAALNLAKKLREDLGWGGQILFLAESQKYALEAFDFHPLHYLLLKDLNDSRLIQCIESAFPSEHGHRNCFICVSKRQKVKIGLDTIQYIRSRGRKIQIHLTDGTLVESYMKLSDAAQRIQNRHFIQIHQSCIVNSVFIKSSRSASIELTNGDRLPISRRYQRAVRSAMMEGDASELPAAETCAV